MGCVDDLPGAQEGRGRASDLHSVFVAGEEIVNGRPEYWEPEIKAHWDATHAPPAGGVAAATSTWTAAERSRVSDQELVAGGEKLHVGSASVAQERAIGDWGKFKVFQPVEEGALSKSVVDTRWRSHGRWRAVKFVGSLWSGVPSLVVLSLFVFRFSR